MSVRPHPLLLVILDGFGHAETQEHNAIAQANTPTWDYLQTHYTHGLIEGSGEYVGLPAGQMGNSEVGHLTLGAGRLVYQDFSRIKKAIETGEFAGVAGFQTAFSHVKKANKALHVMGLLSPGGVHSHEDHFFALLNVAAKQGVEKLYVHAFLDGRDTSPQRAKTSLEKLEQRLNVFKEGKVVSLVGRYYAMDRDKRWERIAPAYDLLTQGKACYEAPDALSGLEMAYARGETDEFVQATRIGAESHALQDGDALIFMNFRADRARQLTQALTEQRFAGFQRKVVPALAHFMTLTSYGEQFALPVAFPPMTLDNVLGAYLSTQGLRQLRIAETEKYAHVTFFFNGGVETPFPGEERVLIPSPDVATYDEKPEMSAPELTDKLIESIQQKKHDVIICNYANPDMVGHTGNLPATVKAVETIDACLKRLYAALRQAGGEMIITADHGNAECMYNEATGQAHTAHTHEPVPFVYVGRPAQFIAHAGALSDIAPTLLSVLNLPIPQEMTGKSLLILEP